MIITDLQLDSFRAEALQKFEDEMTAHVQRYYVNHYKALGEAPLRKAIRYGRARARRYGMISVRNVCMYLNNMILLGSNFDVDPLYPWTSALLTAGDRAADRRMDDMSDQTLALIAAIGGPNNRHIFRALLNLARNSDAIYQQVQAGSPKNLRHVFRQLYPRKVDVVGDANLNLMIAAGIRNARKYGITTWPALGIYSLFMFTMGSGFDTDPQYPWAAAILNDMDGPGEAAKAERLFRTAVPLLNTAIDQYEK